MTECANCGHANKGEAKFCAGCGGLLPIVSTHPARRFGIPFVIGALAIGVVVGSLGGSQFSKHQASLPNTAPCDGAEAPLDINFTGIARGTFVDIVSDGGGGNNGFVAHFVLDDGRCYQAVSNQGTEFVVDGESIWNEELNAATTAMADSRGGLFDAVEKAKGRRVFLKLVGTGSSDSNRAWLDLVETELPSGIEPWMPSAATAKE